MFEIVFSSAWLCHQSSWNRNLPVVRRPSVRLRHRLSPKLLHGFLSNFGCDFPWAICPDFFIFWKKEMFLIFYDYFSFSLTWDTRGAKMLLQNATPPTIAAESFQTFFEFSSQWSSQTYVWDFCNFENWNFYEFYSFSLTWDPMGATISMCYSSYKL